MLLYSPLSSVIVVRLFSIKAALDTSTLTPGSTPPDASLTLPAIAPALVPCARDTAGRRNSAAHMRMVQKTSRLIEWPPWQTVDTTQFARAREPHGSTREPEASVILATVRDCS